MSDTKTILIAYPNEFLCYSKLERKVQFYTSQSPEVRLVAISDPNGYVSAYAEEKGISFELVEGQASAVEEATHAILFEDRECFADLRDALSRAAIPTRVVPLQLTLVVNKDRGDVYDVYIGRGTIWGNPYQMGQDGDRDEVIRKFAYDFGRGFLKASENLEHNLGIIRGKVIACHCKPAACHGDVLADILNAQDDGL
ncbi:DUF4326 domain-containing protein [Pseudomonas kribbensis]|uniref:DUF4326 domain-containing protein n=1 Tax=Pseudomonas kribbensis TaxID=1628086 RepID=UPI003D788F12